MQYLDAFDAAEAKRHMDRQILNGREITVVFAEENRKRPEEMKMKERGRYFGCVHFILTSLIVLSGRTER